MNQISQIPFVLRLETSKNLTSYKFRIVLFNVQLYLIINVNIVDYKFFFFNLSLLIYRKNRMTSYSLMSHIYYWFSEETHNNIILF